MFAGGKYLIVVSGAGANRADVYVNDGTSMKPIPLPPAIPVDNPRPWFVTDVGKYRVVRGNAGERPAMCLYSLPGMALQAFHRGALLDAIDDAGKLGVARTVVDRTGLSLFQV